MRISPLTLLVLALAAVPAPPASAAAASALTPARVAAALAAHPVRSLAGGTLSLASLQGQVVVLNFWASWCGPCRKELPRLAALDAELAKRGGRVVAVSIDSDLRNAAEFATRHAPGMTLYHDGPDGLVRTLDVPALPFTLVLGRDGSVVWSGGGADETTLATIGTTARRLSAERAVATESTEGTPR
jgi:cytochrome c biogenesis protein CcmG, thiol:disulfide interchange protein DsbE